MQCFQHFSTTSNQISSLGKPINPHSLRFARSLRRGMSSSDGDGAERIKQNKAVKGGGSEADGKGKLEQIREQMEFYFSDSNLPRDTFLMNKISEDPQGWVSLELIAKFKRMSMMGATTSMMIESVRDSKTVEVNAEGTRIRRTSPIPTQDKTIDKSVVVGLLPESSTLQQLQKFFSKYGKVRGWGKLRTQLIGGSVGKGAERSDGKSKTRSF